jgi:hypothetical protein
MLRTLTKATLLLFVVSNVWAAQDQPQTSPQAVAKFQQVLQKAKMKDKVVNVTLNKEIGNQKKLSGKVGEISDTDFVVTDHKTGTITKLDFADVRQISQKGVKTGLIFAIVGGAVGALVLGCVATGCYETDH